MSAPAGKRFFTPQEVRQHCSEDDAWVSARGKVLDLTPLIARYRGTLTNPLVRVAGSDISHWFDPDTQDLRTTIDVETGLQTYAQPFGRFVHVPTLSVDTTIDLECETPWWQDSKLIIGELTKKPRKLRVINTLNLHETTRPIPWQSGSHVSPSVAAGIPSGEGTPSSG
jgi:hypothetical protein